MKYLSKQKENPVSTVDVSQKLWPDEHLVPDPDTGEPIVVNKGDVDVDALIQAGRSLCIDLNDVMEQDLETAKALRPGYDKDGHFLGYSVGDEVIDTSALAGLKDGLNSVLAAQATAKGAGFDTIEAYVQDLVNKEIAKQKAAVEAAGKEAE